MIQFLIDTFAMVLVISLVILSEWYFNDDSSMAE